MFDYFDMEKVLNNGCQETQFKIIAIKVGSKDCIGSRKLAENEFYYFYQGYKIADDGDSINIDRDVIAPNELYNEWMLGNNNDQHNVAISISAIVGQNGSGKSSVVEFAIRLINNFSASVIGEYPVNPKAKKLSYINNMSGELYYYSNGVYYVLCVLNRRVVICEYTPIGADGFLKKSSIAIYDNQSEIRFRLHKEHQSLLSEYFFYTFVSNYSLYAYNEKDYAFENSVSLKISLKECLRLRKSPIIRNIASYWLSVKFVG
ncbi:MAG: hypothetical protein R3Y59_10580 [bacterium]